MKKLLLLSAFLCIGLALNAQPADPDATSEAKALFERLEKLQKKGTMYGHQDDLVTGRTWWEEKERSDTKEAVGDYPAVAGFELGELELGYKRSLDSIAFSSISDRIRWFHEKGGIITISWHVVNPVSSQWPGIKEPNGAGSAWDVSMLSTDGVNAVRSVLPGGENHAMFNSWLIRLAGFFYTLKDKDGNLIPFIFRPYHSHSVWKRQSPMLCAANPVKQNQVSSRADLVSMLYIRDSSFLFLPLLHTSSVTLWNQATGQ
jgi:mannan endo-1,4-beta-mannosidase